LISWAIEATSCPHGGDPHGVGEIRLDSAQRLLGPPSFLDERREQHQWDRDRHEEGRQRDGIVGRDRREGWSFEALADEEQQCAHEGDGESGRPEGHSRPEQEGERRVEQRQLRGARRASRDQGTDHKEPGEDGHELRGTPRSDVPQSPEPTPGRR
jgi:hypothetical protein